MKAYQTPLIELGQVAQQVLSNTRKMAERGSSRWQIESYLRDCHDCFLQATSAVQTCGYGQLGDDIARALRHARPNAELLGVLAVLASINEATTEFRGFSLGAHQRVRAEVRDHLRLGACDPDDIRLGAELAFSSLQPLVAA